LDSGVNRSVAAVPFIRSAEAINRTVDSFFRAYLKRAASPTELSTALASIVGGATFGSVAAGVLASDEFFNDAVASRP
jgi:hypothetical protein